MHECIKRGERMKCSPRRNRSFLIFDKKGSCAKMRRILSVCGFTVNLWQGYTEEFLFHPAGKRLSSQRYSVGRRRFV